MIPGGQRQAETGSATDCGTGREDTRQTRHDLGESGRCSDPDTLVQQRGGHRPINSERAGSTATLPKPNPVERFGAGPSDDPTWVVLPAGPRHADRCRGPAAGARCALRETVGGLPPARLSKVRAVSRLEDGTNVGQG